MGDKKSSKITHQGDNKKSIFHELDKLILAKKKKRFILKNSKHPPISLIPFSYFTNSIQTGVFIFKGSKIGLNFPVLLSTLKVTMELES